MNKVLLLLSAFFCITSNSIHANYENDLKERINHFGELMMKWEEVDSTWQLNFDEFSEIYRKKNPDADQYKIKNSYKYLREKDEHQFEKIKRARKYIKRIVSWDSLGYVNSDQELLDVYYKVFLTREAQQTYGSEHYYIQVRFIKLGSKLRLGQRFRFSSLYSVRSRMMDLQHGQKARAFRKKLNRLFNTSAYGFAPAKNKHHWFLITFDGSYLNSNTYDTIKSFRNDHIHVIKNGKHNLLNKKGKEVLPEWYPAIEYVSNYRSKHYRVLLKDSTWKTFPNDFDSLGRVKNRASEKEIEVEEDILEVSSQGNYSLNQRRRTENLGIKLRKELSKDYYKKRNIKIKKRRPGIYETNKKEVYDMINHEINDTIATFEGFNWLSSFGDFFRGERNDTIFIINQKGEVNFQTTLTTKSESPGYLLLFDPLSRLFGIYCPYTQLYIEPKYKYIDAIDRDQLFVVVTQDGKYGHLNKKGEALFKQ